MDRVSSKQRRHHSDVVSSNRDDHSSSKRSRHHRYSPPPPSRGRELSPPPLRSAPAPPLGPSEGSYRTLSLGCIDPRIPDERVKHVLFEEFGRLLRGIRVSVDVFYSREQRMVYADFKHSEDAREAKYILDGRLMIEGVLVRVDPVYSRKSQPESFPPAYFEPSKPIHSSTYPAYPHYRRDEEMLLPPQVRDLPPPQMGGDMYRGYDAPPHDGYMYKGGGAKMDRGFGDGPQYDRGGFSSRGKFRGKHDERFPVQHIPPEDDESATRTLFVGNLEGDIQPEEVRAAFESCGFVEDVDVKVAASRSGSTYAFVRFLTLDMAFHAKCTMTGHFVRNQPCRIGYGKPKFSPIVWVGGLGPWVSGDVVRREIESICGKVLESLDWPPANNFAYATFSTQDEAVAAVRLLRGREIGGRRVRTDFADAPIPAGGMLHNGAMDRPHHDHHRGNGREPPARSRSDEKMRSGRDATSDKRSDPCLATSLMELASWSTSCWSVNFVLKNSEFLAAVHFVGGSSHCASLALPRGTRVHSIKVDQRLKLESFKLGEIRARMIDNRYAVMVALPPTDETDTSVTVTGLRRPLRSLATYFKGKDAAGVVTLAAGGPDGERGGCLLHLFPTGSFSEEALRRFLPRLGRECLNDDNYLVVVVLKN